MLKKKMVIAISSIVVLVGLIILLAFTVFSLKSVKIDFRTSTQNIVATDKEIIDNANFNMGESVLFSSKKKYIKKIESINPYIKVVNIETVFPCSYVVHLVERQEVFAVKFESGYYICDEQLRVLRISYFYSPSSDNAILLQQQGLQVSNSLIEGDYIKNMRVPEIYSVLFGLNRPLGEQKALIESITLTSEYDSVIKKEQNITILKYYSGQTFKIINDGYGLKYKVKLMNDVYTQLYEFIGKTIKDKDKNEIVLTQEMLNDCTIIICNYYDYTTHTVKDCYFDIIIN